MPSTAQNNYREGATTRSKMTSKAWKGQWQLLCPLLTLSIPWSAKKSSHCGRTYGPTVKPWGHARLWRKPRRDQKEVWPAQHSGNCLAHQGGTSQQEEQSKTHSHDFLSRSIHNLWILTLTDVLGAQTFIPNDHHKPLLWCSVRDPKGVEGLRNSGSNTFKELWRYAQEACLKGSILLGNNLFLDTCRGPADRTSV